MNATDRSLHVLAKPTGAACNLDCRYCFFLSKGSLYPERRPRMSDEIMEAYIRQVLTAPGAEGEAVIAWQGGEPTLMGIDFYRRAMAAVERHRRPGQVVQHTMQTNGVLLDDEWCSFLKQHNVLVGLSVDGPRALHDAYRVGRDGGGSFDQVMRGWQALRRHQVDVNVLCTVHAANGDHPLEVYRFFRDEMQAGYLQFIPIVERTTPEQQALANQNWGGRHGSDRPLYRQQGALVTDRSVAPEHYGRFLNAIFDEWVQRDVGKVFVQIFDVTLGSFLGQHSLCIFSPTCGSAVCLEHNGDLYSCDHYVEPGHRLGNISQRALHELATSPQQQRFGDAKLTTLPRQCRECPVRFACHGECPRNRFITTADGEPGLNYLCAGYKSFFSHVDRPMRTMAQLLRQGRFADEIMGLDVESAATLVAAAPDLRDTEAKG